VILVSSSIKIVQLKKKVKEQVLGNDGVISLDLMVNKGWTVAKLKNKDISKL
jgi:hypothetical protein